MTRLLLNMITGVLDRAHIGLLERTGLGDILVWVVCADVFHDVS